MSVEKVAGASEAPAVEQSKEDEKKVQLPVTEQEQWYRDGIASDHANFLKIEAADSAARSWLDWMRENARAALGGIQAVGGGAVAYTAAAWHAISAIVDPGSWMQGCQQVTFSLWNTFSYATEAIENGAERVIIPKQNIDGSKNLFGDRIVTRSDLTALHAFRENTFAFLDSLETVKELTEGDEATLIALLKALAEDKQKEYEILKEKLLLNRGDRDLDLKKHLELMKELSGKIKDNRWYDWVFEVTQHSTLAFAGLALGAAGGGWFWPIAVIVFAGCGLLNLYAGNPIEKTGASLTSKASTWALGGDSQKAEQEHIRYFKSAHSVLSVLFMLSVGAHQTAGLANAAIKTILSVGSIAQNATQYRKASLHYESGKVDAELNDVARHLKERDDALAKTFPEFTNSHKKQVRMLEQAAEQLQRSAAIIRSLLRNR